MAGKINGIDLVITIGGTQISNLNDTSLSMGNTVIDCTNYDGDGWRELLVGTKTWTMSGSAYVDYAAAEGWTDAYGSFIAGTSVVVTMELATNTTGDGVYTGTAYFTSLEKSGSLDEVVSWTFTLEGTGALVETITA
jgi:predicted secreted protein